MERYLCHATLRRVLAILCVVGLIAHATAVLYLRVPHERDFDLHRLIGTWFLNHQNLYGCGVCYPYMPAGAMYFSLLALVSRSVGFTLRYAVAMACLAMTCVWLHRMVKDRFPELARARLALSVATVMLALKFIMYDFDDGGPHTILLGMMVGGLYAVWNGRERLGAVWLGLAIALKVTPGLFLPFFLWKRQWRLAGYTAAAATGWILLPLLWMGPASWWDHQVTWTRVAAGSVIGLKSEYTDMNEDNIRNSGLNPALMRYLVTLSPDHPLRQNDPGYVPMLDMPPRQARVIVLAAIGGLLLFFGWHTRRAYQGPGDQDWARECSAVILLMLFLSPLTWIQHLPWLVPALYWIVAKACSREGLSRVGNAALGVWAVIALVLNYSVLGKRHYMVVLSYKPFAIGMFLLFLLVMVKWKERPNPSYFLADPSLMPNNLTPFAVVAGVHVIEHASEVPEPAVLQPGEAFVVPDFDLAEALIARGADSSRVAISGGDASAESNRQYHPVVVDKELVPKVPFRFEQSSLVVLPTYNERRNLQAMIETIGTYLVTDVLVVDDNSPDGTGVLADQLTVRHAWVHVLHRTKKEGLGPAYLAGFRWALSRGYQLIIEMDCDFSHPPWDLPRLVHRSRTADLVIGSRYVPGGGTQNWDMRRRWVSRLGNGYVSLFLGTHIRDWTGGFRCYRRDVLAGIDLEQVRAKGYVFQVEMAWRAKQAGAVVAEIPIRFTDRLHGQSKLGWRSIVEAVTQVPRMPFHTPVTRRTSLQESRTD